MNVPRIKGSHNAILSGMLAAEAAFAAIGEGRAGDELTGYEDAFATSPIAKDLRRVRNVKPLLSKLGTRLGTMLGGAEMWLNTLLPFLSLHAPARQARQRVPQTRQRVQAHRLSEARRRADLRPAVVGVPVRHQPRGRSAGASGAGGPGDADPRQPAGLRRARAALLPGGGV